MKPRVVDQQRVDRSETSRLVDSALVQDETFQSEIDLNRFLYFYFVVICIWWTEKKANGSFNLIICRGPIWK